MQLTPNPSFRSERPQSPLCLIKDIAILLGIVGLFLSFSPDPVATNDDREVKILFELYSDTSRDRDRLIKKVEATQRSFEEVARLAVLLSDDAVNVVVDDNTPSRLERLMEKGVEVLVCEESLEAREIGAETVHALAIPVESASEESSERRADGWAIVGEGETYVSTVPDDES